MIDIDYVTAYDAFLNKFMFTFQSRKGLGKETNTDLSNNLSGHTTDSGREADQCRMFWFPRICYPLLIEPH